MATTHTQQLIQLLFLIGTFQECMINPPILDGLGICRRSQEVCVSLAFSVALFFLVVGRSCGILALVFSNTAYLQRDCPHTGHFKHDIFSGQLERVVSMQ